MVHLELSRWQQGVINAAETSLFPSLDYQGAIYNNPRNFNLHLLLALMSETTESYADINIEISKDKSRKDQREHAEDDRLQCCCSKPITCCFIINGPYGEMLVGSECIGKNNFKSRQEMNKLKREIEERDMTPQKREEKEEKKRINKEKQKEKRQAERKKKEAETARKQKEERDRYLEECRMREEERKKKEAETDRKQKEERDRYLEECRMREEERKQRLLEKLIREEEEVKQKKKYNLDNGICNKCGKHFQNKGIYELCFPCKPKCECGNVVNPPFEKCFECNQQSKKDICISCKKVFDGKGKYKRCYSCK
jgi:hypothetical protein